MRKLIRGGVMAAVLAAVVGLPSLSAVAYEQSGVASWYSSLRVTASGERSHAGAMVAAHKSLPFGTLVRVTNKRNGRSVTVRIIDRGPFIRGRIIDLTPAAARAIGSYGSGLARVTIETVGRVHYAKRRYRKRVRVASRSHKRYTISRRAKRKAISKRARIRVASLRRSQQASKAPVKVQRPRSIDTYFMRLAESAA